MKTMSALYSNREQSTGQSVKTKHIAKCKRLVKTTSPKRTKDASKVTFVSDVKIVLEVHILMYYVRRMPKPARINPNVQ